MKFTSVMSPINLSDAFLCDPTATQEGYKMTSLPLLMASGQKNLKKKAEHLKSYYLGK